MSATFIRYPSVTGLIDASGNLATITGGGALNVNVVGATLDVGVADESAFTYGTSVMQPIGGVYQDTSPTLTAGHTGAIRITQYRGAHANLRTSGGVELLGQQLSAASVPVVLASDQPAVAVSSGGLSSVNAPAINNYSSTNVTTSAYVQVVASTTGTTKVIEIFDSSGQYLYLATGASGFEVNQFIVTPGGNGQVPLLIPSGTRVSLKAISATASTGSFLANFYG